VWFFVDVTPGTVPKVKPASVRVGWKNAGGIAEANAYNYEGTKDYKDPDDPARCVSAFVPSCRCSSVSSIKMRVLSTRTLTPFDLRPLFFTPTHRPNMGTGYLQGGRDYFRVNDAGENTDTRVRAICPAVGFSCR
jgi:hypothetical protein